jgi:hypothetical protein
MAYTQLILNAKDEWRARKIIENNNIIISHINYCKNKLTCEKCIDELRRKKTMLSLKIIF